jgi:CDP-diacylglycerol--glycerol-3-phosphate 3-phosphatidyltransferase
VTEERESGESAPVVSNWNLPNALTMVRILLVPVYAVLLAQDTVGSRIGACLVFVVAALTDRWDGHIARTRGLITKFGTILDTLADKILVVAALVVLSMIGEVPWWVTIVMVVREFGIMALKSGLARREVIAPSSGGKLKAVLQMVALSVLSVDWVGLLGEPVGQWVYWLGMAILYAATLIAVLTAVDYVVKALRIMRTGQSAKR